MRYLASFSILLLSLVLSGQQVNMDDFHGMTPRNIGPAGMSGRVTSIDVDLSDKDNIFIGTAAGGVWSSTNAGHTWTPIFDNELAASVGDVEIYQKNPSIIYVGTGEGNPRNSQNSGWGMYKTIDGGASWKHLGLELTRQIHRIIIHPNNPDHVTVGVSGASWGSSSERGVYVTRDGGMTWKKTLYVNDHTGVADLIVDPNNPNKMFCAMWEHKRWPWFFKSGGDGSGLYISNDAGDTWKKLSKKDGLPKGELGRIGLSIAPSNSNYVYAYIESKDNAVYRSTDGGKTWERRSKPMDSGIGSRPFYYADIYVDTKNENRVYSIASIVTVTDDGGKSWNTFAPGNKIHTDHHAWWSDPTDPEFIMIGHDGGLNITHDRGKNWWFADNLPLAQFYHIRVDNAFPYNVMGGLQDNGSWRGPSQTWFKGGIRNSYWQRLSVGDGFDVVPDPIDNDYGYAMGQAGNLVRWHAPSGQLTKVKPVHPEGEFLRFNWNAGIAICPIDQKTIYYGSQYLHKSEDDGASWEIISPDLTTNDPKKQEWLETGGLTYDVTGAENHTTIITIDPSPINKEVIWVGTDDGNIQVTQNGGQTWTNTVSNITGIPANTWVTQITASTYDPASAVAVLEDHRRNNWEPYVFQTSNYGQTWTRLVDDSDVRGYTFSFAQDPIEPNLMFVGTEFGLYVSFDAGSIWNKWTNGLPTMPITDLVIHPRDHDLVIGTFGRAIWILDDIRPLREIASQGISAIGNKKAHLFKPANAHQMIIGESIGYRQGKVGDALYNGENRKYGALFNYYLNDNTIDGGKVKIEILNDKKQVIRTLYQNPKSGVNRVPWNLAEDAQRRPNMAKSDKKQVQKRSGWYVSPGKYNVKFTYEDLIEEQPIEVIADPRINISQSEIDQKAKMIAAYKSLHGDVVEMADDIRDSQKKIKLIKELVALNEVQKEDTIYATIKMNMDTLQSLHEMMFGKDVQGIYRQPDVLSVQLRNLGYLIDHPQAPVTANQQTLLKTTIMNVNTATKHIYEVLNSPNMTFMKERVKELNLNLFR